MNTAMSAAGGEKEEPAEEPHQPHYRRKRGEDVLFEVSFSECICHDGPDEECKEDKHEEPADHNDCCICAFDRHSGDPWPCYKVQKWYKKKCDTCNKSGFCPPIGPKAIEVDCYCNPQMCVAFAGGTILKLWEYYNNGAPTDDPGFLEALGFSGMTDEVAILTKARENMMFAMSAFSNEERKNMSYSQDELIHKCSYNGQQCDLDQGTRETHHKMERAPDVLIISTDGENPQEDEAHPTEQLSKQDVERMLDEGRIEMGPPRGESEILSKFATLVYPIDGTPIPDVVACIECRCIYSYKPVYGPSSLKRHLEGDKHAKRNGSATQKRVTAYSSVKRDSKLMTRLKKEATEHVVEMTATDFRPFSMVSKPGFLKFAQWLLDAGSHGKIQAKELLPVPSTVSNNVAKTAEDLIEQKLPDILSHLKEFGGGATTDLWKDSMTGTNYLCLTVHYFDESGILRKLTISVAEFPDQPKTGENIRSLLQATFQKFEIPGEKLIFTTDSDSKVRCAVRPLTYTNLTCACHRINTIVEYAFESKDMPEEVTQVIAASKAFIAFAKRTDINRKLKTKKLKQEISTRWLSSADMIESLLNAQQELIPLLKETGNSDRIADIDFELLQSIYALLKPFSDAVTLLEADTTITLPMVPVQFAILEAKCKDDPKHDTELIRRMKAELRKYLEEKSPLEPIHFVALRLNPRKKKLGRFPNWEKSSRELLEKMFAEESSDLAAQALSDEDMPPEKRVRLDDYDDEDADKAVKPLTELEQYMADALPSQNYDFDRNLIQLWEDCKEKYPTLRRIARRILAVPASSASSERVFSLAGFTKTPRRNRLSSSSLESVILLNSYYNFIGSE